MNWSEYALKYVPINVTNFIYCILTHILHQFCAYRTYFTINFCRKLIFPLCFLYALCVQVVGNIDATNWLLNWSSRPEIVPPR